MPKKRWAARLTLLSTDSVLLGLMTNKRPPPVSADGAPERRPRRGRPRSIDSEQLLTVAREVFLERGIRATTLEVAVRAGVSEGALFHRFKNKEGLFRAAMELPAEQVPELLLEAVQRLHDLELRERVRIARRRVEQNRPVEGTSRRL